MDVTTVRNAVEKAGSVRKAAILLGVSHNTLTYWMLCNGYQIVKRATIVPRPFPSAEVARQG